MKILLLFIFAFSILLPSQGQKIRQITGVKTYLYEQKDYEPVKIDSNIIIRYDEKGRLLRYSRIEEVCHEYYVYNEKDELAEENSYCGEGHSECKTEKKGNIQTTECHTNYHESIQMDSLDEKGRVTYSVNHLKRYDFDSDIPIPETYYTRYIYDKNGNEISHVHWGNDYHRSIRRNFSESGKLNYKVIVDTIDYHQDSIVMTYDESGRIIEMREYVNVYKDGDYQKFESLNFLYSPLKINKTNSTDQKFNDTLLNDHLPYPPFSYELPELTNPVEITYTTLETADPLNTPSKIKYQYGYDEKGRLTSITGKDLSTSTPRPLIEAVIGYFPEGRTLLSKKEYWSSYIYQTHHEYLNGHLQKIVEVDAKDETKITSRHEFTYDYFK